METTVSSNLSEVDQLYDPVRRDWFAARPEEQVRQHLLRYMIDDLSFPTNLLACEVSLREMPHITLPQAKLPDRRADVLAYAKGIHPDFDLYPLLLIECKAVPLDTKARRQLCGYNQYVGAYYIALVNQDEIKLGYYDHDLGDYRFVDGLSSYPELLSTVDSTYPNS